METFFLIIQIWLILGLCLGVLYQMCLFLIAPKTSIYWWKTDLKYAIRSTLLILAASTVLGPFIILILIAMRHDIYQAIQDGDEILLRKLIIEQKEKVKRERSLVINWNECEDCDNCENCNHNH